MSAVGFEPTRSKTLRPERNPLDHSGKLTLAQNNTQFLQTHHIQHTTNTQQTQHTTQHNTHTPEHKKDTSHTLTLPASSTRRRAGLCLSPLKRPSLQLEATHSCGNAADADADADADANADANANANAKADGTESCEQPSTTQPQTNRRERH